MKIYNASKEVAGVAIDAKHMANESYREMFKAVFNRDLPTAICSLLENAEWVRDRVMQGKKTLEQKKCEAIHDWATKRGSQIIRWMPRRKLLW